MNFELTPALIGLAGIVVGGAIQASVQLILARRTHERTLKAQAYLTFFQGVAAASHSRTDQELSEGNTLMAEGRALVAIYGSEKVVEAMAKSFRHAGKLHDDGSWEVHAAVLKAMREDTSGEEYGASIRDLFEVLYGAKERVK
jgi:hypothetical protein